MKTTCGLAAGSATAGEPSPTNQARPRVIIEGPFSPERSLLRRPHGGLPSLPDVHRAGVLPRRAFRAPAVGDVAVQELRQPPDDLGVPVVQAGALAHVVGQVEQLNGGELARVVAARARRAPPAGPGAQAQLPGALADGERAVDGVVDDGRPQAARLLAAEG